MKIKGLSEKDIIQALKQKFGAAHKNIILGIGDDAAAILPGDKYQVLTKDLLIENVHFLAAQHPPQLLGRKSLNVNLSDVAAMGCKPQYALYGLGLPEETEPAWIEKFVSGLQQALNEFEVFLLGGDITRAERISISVTLLGEGERLITRSGAQDGDKLYVSGTLGDAALGLKLLQSHSDLGDDPRQDVCLKAFLDPVPQVALGQTLAISNIPSAMIDISDGLSVDLGHICEESGVGAEVYEYKLPLSKAVAELAANPLDLALHGGEDYQLLFSAPPEKESQIRGLSGSPQVSEIGRFISEKEIFLVSVDGKRRSFESRGFQHFKTQKA
jgi:thiamine-monophosphate kinase